MKKKTHRMKTTGKKLTVLALACGMTISMMPFQAAATTESELPNLAASAKGSRLTGAVNSGKKYPECVPNQVVVQYKEGAVTTDAPTTKEKKMARRAATAESFGSAMKEKSGERQKKAENTLGQQAEILEKSLDKYEIQDTIALTPTKSSEDETVISVVSSKDGSAKTLAKELEKNPEIKNAEPNYIFEAKDTGNRTGWNDEYLRTAWHLDGIHASAGWEAYDKTAEKSAKDVVVAVMDTGIDYEHEELKSHMWKAPKGFKLTGTYGHDFVEEEADFWDILLGGNASDDPDGIDPMDQNGHGTHCAGIIAAQANNGTGTAGVFGSDKSGDSSGIRLMGIRVLDSDGSGTLSGILKGFYYTIRAKQLGVNLKAINCSFGADVDSDIYDSVIDEAGKAGILTICAAGNETSDNDLIANAPANTGSDYGVSVAASAEDGTLASYSNYGKRNVDVMAPGTNILSSVSYPNYTPWLYSADKVKQLSEYYGEFNKDSIKENGITPVTGTDASGKSIDGMKEFGAAVTGKKLSKGSKGKAELTIDESEDANFRASGDKIALKWKITGAKNGDMFLLYFPYEKSGESDGSNTYCNIAYRTITQGGGSGFFIAGDIAADVSDQGTIQSLNVASEDINQTDSSMNDVWRAEGNTDLLSASGAKGENFGLGFIYQVGDEGDATIEISSLGISKAGADADQFGKYALFSGTSMATPVVTGSVALIAAMNPTADAKQLKSILYQTTNDRYKNEVSTGGGIDFDEYTANSVSAKPAVRSAKVDPKKNQVILEGAGFGTHPEITVTNTVQDTKRDIASKDVSSDGSKITISNASSYNLAGSSIAFSIKNGEKTGRGTFYLVKGNAEYKKEFVLSDEAEERSDAAARNKSSSSKDLLDDEEDASSDGDNVQWIPNDIRKLGYDAGSGNLYTVDKNDYDQVGQSLDDAVTKYAKSQEKKHFLWKLKKGERPEITLVTNATYMRGNVYEVICCDLGDRKTYMLVGMDLTGSKKNWTVYSDTLIDKGSMPSTIDEESAGCTALAGMNGNLYLTGGAKKEGKKIMPSAETWSCPVKSGAVWKKKANLPEGLYDGKAFAQNGKLYYVLGRNSNGLNYDVMAFNGSKWQKAGTLPKVLNTTLTQDVFEQNLVSCAVGLDAKGIVFGGASSDGKGDTYRFNTSTGKTEALSYTLWGKGQETAAYGSSAGNRFYAEYVSYDDDITYETFKSIPVESAYRTFKVKKSGKGSGTVTGTAGVLNGETITLKITPKKGSYVYSYSISRYGKKKSFKKPTSAAKKGQSIKLKATKDATITVHFGKICTKVKMNRKSVSLKRGKSIKLKASANGTNRSVIWTVSNRKYAKVTKSGKVTIRRSARRGAKIRVTARSKENRKLKAVCVVKVR